jgi:hypothetical protein
MTSPRGEDELMVVEKYGRLKKMYLYLRDEGNIYNRYDGM